MPAGQPVTPPAELRIAHTDDLVPPRAYELGALGSTDAGAAFYTARGWLRWLGSCSALTPEGITRIADEEGYIYVFAVTNPLDGSRARTCGWREGDAW